MSVLFDGRPSGTLGNESVALNSVQNTGRFRPPWRQGKNENVEVTNNISIVDPDTEGIGDKADKVFRFTADATTTDARRRIELNRNRTDTDISGSDTAEVTQVTRWYGISFYWPSGWTNLVDEFSYMLQFKDLNGQTGSGPLWGFERRLGTLTWHIDNFAADGFIRSVTLLDAVTKAHWYDIKMELKYSRSQTGYVRIWMKDWTAGETAWTKFFDTSGNTHTTLRDPTLSDNDYCQFQHGIYTSRKNTGTYTYYSSGLVVATAEADIDDVFGGSGASTPTIQTTTLPDGQKDTAYLETLLATGGTTPYAWSVVTGSLPTGLTLDTDSGDISGTPTVSATSNFTVRVTDDDAQTDDQALSIVIADTAPEVEPALTAGQTRFGYVDADGAPIIGGLRGSLGLNKVALNKYATGLATDEQANVRKVWVYVGGDPAVAGTQKLRVVFYEDDGTGGEPGTLIGQTGELTVTSGDAEDWYSISVTADALIVTGENVWAGIRSGATAALTRVAQDTVTDSNRSINDTYTSAPVDPYGTPTTNSNQRSLLVDSVFEAGTSGGGGDVTAPSVSSAEGNRTQVDIICDEALDPASVPAASTFYVAVNGGSIGVSSADISGSTISLALDSTLSADDFVRVTYVQPGSNQAQDLAGNLLASFSQQTVTNLTPGDFEISDGTRDSGTRVVGGTRVIGGTRYLGPGGGGG